MTQISELDLQNLRHLIGGFETTHCKMDAYAQQGNGHGSETVLSEIRTVSNAEQTAVNAVLTVGGREYE